MFVSKNPDGPVMGYESWVGHRNMIADFNQVRLSGKGASGNADEPAVIADRYPPLSCEIYIVNFEDVGTVMK